ncbi:MAG: type II toxin-antitoxin system HicB family antitoxin [Porphyrobacter sp.]|nr:type II toxin-antitoxin system HicB family antitoxin [Porphyrobacter sp.]
MAKHFYPGVLYPADADGLFGVFVPNVNVMASGSSADEALADAAEILQEYCDNLADKGEAPEPPAQIDEIELDGGQIVMLPVLMPAEQARLNIMMDATLVKRIDAVAPNRSAFLSAAARAQLALMRAEGGEQGSAAKSPRKRARRAEA